DVEQTLLLVVLVLVHFSDLEDLAHDLRLETGTFGFGVDFLDVLTERPLLLLEPLDALDKGLQLCARDTPNIRHNPLSPGGDAAPAAGPGRYPSRPAGTRARRARAARSAETGFAPGHGGFTAAHGSAFHPCAGTGWIADF